VRFFCACGGCELADLRAFVDIGSSIGVSERKERMGQIGVDKPLASCTKAIFTGFFSRPAILAMPLFLPYISVVPIPLDLMTNWRSVRRRSVLNMLCHCELKFDDVIERWGFP